MKRTQGLTRHKRLNPKSDQQRERDRLWNEITAERCYEMGFICLWCGRPGQRNDPTRFDYLDGHHTKKPRRSHNEKKYCYPVHRAPCHGEIEDNNIDVEQYPNRENWLRSKANAR
jgi:hypothetical protein